MTLPVSSTRLPMERVSLEELDANPYPLFHRWRVARPVVWVEPLGMWFVTRYDDVLEVLRDPVRFTTAAADVALTFVEQFGDIAPGTVFRYSADAANPRHWPATLEV